jgi:cytochrome c oxidase subunit 2
MTTLASLSDFFAWLSGPWMPEDGGGFTQNVDALNGFILAVCYFFSVLIAGLMIWFCIKYRQKDKQEVGHGAHHSTPIEIAWTLPPLIIVLIIFGVGFKGYLDMATPPTAGNAFAVRAEAKQWGWNFYYPNGGVSPDLYIPADRPVRITLESLDVLHGLYVPAMRIKKDVVPGRFNEMWFEPDPDAVSAENPVAEYRFNCTEYCGQGHAHMNGWVYVVHESEWEAQLEELKKFNPDGLPPVELGRDLYQNRGGCAACHSLDGATNTGPTWLGLYGSERNLAISNTDEMTVIADDAYLYESIRYPNLKKAEGYASGNMAAYGPGVLKAGDVRALIEFMKTLSGEEAIESWPEGYDGEVPLEEFEGGDASGGEGAAEAETTSGGEADTTSGGEAAE